MPRSCETCSLRKIFRQWADKAPDALNDFDFKGAGLTMDDVQIASDTVEQIHEEIENQVPNCPGHRRFDVLAGTISYDSLISGREFACRNIFVQRGHGEGYRNLMLQLIEHSGELS